ncbi:hypothetical protein D5046_24735 [Verminephrobacter eiseniae]|nr:hypothetical protein [Verminephrobacter eiseniae]
MRSLVFGLWSLVFGLWSLVFGLWSLVFGLWSLTLGANGPDPSPPFALRRCAGRCCQCAAIRCRWPPALRRIRRSADPLVTAGATGRRAQSPAAPRAGLRPGPAP